MKPEQKVSKAIRTYLKWRKIRCWSSEQGYRKERGGTRTDPGIPDLICAGRGLTFMIEVKSPSGRMSKHQKDFEAAWKDNNGLHLVARSAADVEAFLREHGVTVPEIG